jgi:hypothetical protein
VEELEIKYKTLIVDYSLHKNVRANGCPKSKEKCFCSKFESLDEEAICDNGAYRKQLRTQEEQERYIAGPPVVKKTD